MAVPTEDQILAAPTDDVLADLTEDLLAAWAADDELVRAAFDEIVAAEWPDPPSPGARRPLFGRGPGSGPPGAAAEGSMPCRRRWLATPGRVRERSPPWAQPAPVT